MFIDKFQVHISKTFFSYFDHAYLGPSKGVSSRRRWRVRWLLAFLVLISNLKLVFPSVLGTVQAWGEL